jgi:GNAT superfamily N-acetyltransferase
MRHTKGRIRSFDPFQDVETVVELIAAAFGDRLDPAGRATLDRMQRFARGGPLLQWLWLFLVRARAAPGLVWEDDGRIVGNASLRRARDRGGYLIGNVVVHPDWRGRGIGRALMRAAIERASRRGAQWVGLEVRADNDLARQLYEDLDFEEVGSTQHMLRPAGLPWKRSRSHLKSARRGSSRDGSDLVELMLAAIPREQRQILEVQEIDYRPTRKRALEHCLRGEREVWWLVDCGGVLCAAVRAVRKSGRFPNQLEIFVRAGHEGRYESALVRRGIASLRGSARKPVEIQLPRPCVHSLPALEREGFEKLRVLIQMKRSLRQRISVNVRMTG